MKLTCLPPVNSALAFRAQQLRPADSLVFQSLPRQTKLLHLLHSKSLQVSGLPSTTGLTGKSSQLFP